MEQGVKVLIIEDNREIREYFACTAENLFGGKVELILATCLEDARVIFDQMINEGLDMVFIDACLHSTQPNSMPLIKHIIQTFRGPFYAMSCNKDFVAPLLRAGCSNTCLKRKFYLEIDKLLNEGLPAF